MEHTYQIIQSADRKIVMTVTGTWRRVELTVYLLNSAGYGVIAKRVDRPQVEQLQLAYAA